MATRKKKKKKKGKKKKRARAARESRPAAPKIKYQTRNENPRLDLVLTIKVGTSAQTGVTIVKDHDVKAGELYHSHTSDTATKYTHARVIFTNAEDKDSPWEATWRSQKVKGKRPKFGEIEAVFSKKKNVTVSFPDTAGEAF